MVATWLLELYMDQINRALLEEPAPPVTSEGQDPDYSSGDQPAPATHANGDVSGAAPLQQVFVAQLDGSSVAGCSNVHHGGADRCLYEAEAMACFLLPSAELQPAQPPF